MVVIMMDGVVGVDRGGVLPKEGKVNVFQGEATIVEFKGHGRRVAERTAEGDEGTVVRRGGMRRRWDVAEGSCEVGFASVVR